MIGSEYNESVLDRLKDRANEKVNERLTETLYCAWTKEPHPAFVNELRHYIQYNELPEAGCAVDLDDDVLDTLAEILFGS